MFRSFLDRIVNSLSKPPKSPLPATKTAPVPEKMLITRDELLMGREVAAPLTEQMERNLWILLKQLNAFRREYGRPMRVTSGYRPPAINSRGDVGGALKSAHLTCEAADFADPDGSLDAYCTKNLELLEKLGLWLEHPDYTAGWCHLQTRPTRSGRRVFIP